MRGHGLGWPWACPVWHQDGRAAGTWHPSLPVKILQLRGCRPSPLFSTLVGVGISLWRWTREQWVPEMRLLLLWGKSHSKDFIPERVQGGQGGSSQSIGLVARGHPYLGALPSPVGSFGDWRQGRGNQGAVYQLMQRCCQSSGGEMLQRFPPLVGLLKPWRSSSYNVPERLLTWIIKQVTRVADELFFDLQKWWFHMFQCNPKIQ